MPAVTNLLKEPVEAVCIIFLEWEQASNMGLPRRLIIQVSHLAQSLVWLEQPASSRQPHSLSPAGNSDLENESTGLKGKAGPTQVPAGGWNTLGNLPAVLEGLEVTAVGVWKESDIYKHLSYLFQVSYGFYYIYSHFPK